MKRLAFVLFILLPAITWAQEVCINSGGNKFAPQCGYREVSIPIATDTNAYAAGDYINDANVITTITAALGKGSLSGKIVSVVLADEGAEGKNLELWIFASNPAGSTFTDNAAFDVVDADIPKVRCVIPLTLHYASAQGGVSVNHFPGCSIKGASRDLYAAIVAREAVTFDAVDAVTLTVTIAQD